MKSEIEEAILVNAMDPTWCIWPELFDASYVKELLDAGVTVVNETLAYDLDFNETINDLYRLRRVCDATGLVVVARTASDIERAKREGKLAVIFGLQSLPFVKSRYPDDLLYIDLLHKLDVRTAHLTYNRRNLLADGLRDRTDSGLSEFGIKVVEEMNRVGMMIDLAHVGPKGFMEVLEVSKDPVIHSHVGCRVICNNVRNMDDERIKALAEKGGVMGIQMNAGVLNMDRPPTLKDFLDHMTHAIEIAGVDHVGIGMDVGAHPPPFSDANYHKQLYKYRFGTYRANYPWSLAPYQTYVPGIGIPNILKELDCPSKWKASITKGLADRGYSSSEIVKVLGSNFMRVFKKAWRE